MDAMCNVERGRAAVKHEQDGAGRIRVFPGAELTFHRFQGQSHAHRHEPQGDCLEINHCRSGRIGWEMDGGFTLYMGPGDLALHRMDRCADSVLRFPLGSYEGISLELDTAVLAQSLPEDLRLAGADPTVLAERFCPDGGVTALPAGERIARIFDVLYDLPEAVRPVWCRLKVQELLLFLALVDPAKEKSLNQVLSQQVEIVKEVHGELTAHLDRRPTIEALSRRYLINTTALKTTFKAVYGQPIAAYMKGCRVREAARLLRETDDPVAEIARRVGYESQSKFTGAFRDLEKVSPTEYRRQQRKNRE